MLIINNCILVICAYLLGSISSAILLCRCFKLPDPRSCGSKNPGTTNVLRVANKSIAAIVLLLDVSKGFFIVYLSKYLNMPDGLTAIVALAVFLGHLYPIFFNFSGGKGVATTLGIILAFNWQLGLVSLMIWVITFITTRISSLAALITTITTAMLASVALLFNLNKFIQAKFSMGIILIGLLIILKHKTNIYNLINKQEKKI